MTLTPCHVSDTSDSATCITFAHLVSTSAYPVLVEWLLILAFKSVAYAKMSTVHNFPISVKKCFYIFLKQTLVTFLDRMSSSVTCIYFFLFFLYIYPAYLDTDDDCHGSGVEKLPTIATAATAKPKPKPVSQQHVTVMKTTMIGQPDVLVLPQGAKVMIPFGTTLLLPPGSQIQEMMNQKEMTTMSSPLLAIPPSVTSHHHDAEDVTSFSSGHQQNTTAAIFTENKPNEEAVTMDYDDYGSDVDDNIISTTEFDPFPR